MHTNDTLYFSNSLSDTSRNFWMRSLTESNDSPAIKKWENIRYLYQVSIYLDLYFIIFLTAILSGPVLSAFFLISHFRSQFLYFLNFLYDIWISLLLNYLCISLYHPQTQCFVLKGLISVAQDAVTRVFILLN